MLNIPEFKFPNIQTPNPTEWATNAAEIFTKSISDKLMQLFMDACKTVLEIIDDVINTNIDAYVHNYLLYDDTKYSIGHIFKHTLFKMTFSIRNDVSKGLFRDHYYVIPESLWVLHCVSHDGALLKLTPKKITSKYLQL